MTEHLFKLSELEPQEKTVGGTRTRAYKKNFPALAGMSFYKLTLNKKGFREPHWHANSDELGFCLKGKLLVSLYATIDEKETFVVNEGDLFFIPSGTLHYVENISDENAELILYFLNEEVEDFNLSSTFGMFSDAVLGNTWDKEAKIFEPFQRSFEKSTFASLRDGSPEILDSMLYKSPYLYSLKKQEPILENESGKVRMAKNSFWPILKRQALYWLDLTGVGMREPHWHPETAELGFIKQGKGRMSVLSPSGTLDTYRMNAGDIYFIPKAYPHHIENLTDENLEILIFFDQPMPEDIGFTGSVRSYSSEVLAATTGQKPGFFDQLPKYYRDLFIVKKKNPVDP